MQPNVLIVGAGLTGATLAERFASIGKRVLVLDNRYHVAGNCYDAHDDHGVHLHWYGPHYFHTKSPRIWHYVNQFSEWRPYEHRAQLMLAGESIPLPVNFCSIEQLWPFQAHDMIEQLRAAFQPYNRRVTVQQLRTHASADIRALGEFLYDHVYADYSFKMWGVEPATLQKHVLERVPVICGTDNRYFDDEFQALPVNGYTSLVHRMLDHKLIRVELDTDYFKVRHRFSSELTIYTGLIDRYFNYTLGPLAYRSLRFEQKYATANTVQNVGQVNFPERKVPYLRTLEYKIITGQSCKGTTRVFDYPEHYLPGKNEPFYPMPLDPCRRLYESYLQFAKQERDVFFAGRLGTYQYLNMDQAIGAALALFDRIAK